jgi:membrane-anchored protein YejM (alkaline phosphatase superfamily)
MAVLLIIFLNWRIYKWAIRKPLRYQKLTIFSLLVLLLFGQVVHIWASEYKQHFIQQYTPYFPYYFPTTSHSLMKKIEKKHPNWIPQPVEKAHQHFSLHKEQSKNSLLNYPLQKLQFIDSINKPNILMVVLESWRTDFLSPDATPMLDSLSKHSLRFNNHYSGGNVTVSGIFSLMYGLHPTYLSYVQADAYRYQTTLTKSLTALNYDIKAYTSSNFDRFSLKAMLFGHIKNNHYVNVLKGRADQADRKVVDKLVVDIQEEKKESWYKFVFLTSSHHHYNYPDKYKIFMPLPTNSEGFIFDKNIDSQPFINDYKNALRYEDALLSEVINALKIAGKYKNTIIIITGDHAEEFNDNKQAYWGHGSNFTKYQTSVPLIVHLPNQQNGRIIKRLTSHIDIVPTILNDYLYCQNPINTYSSGKSLLDSISTRGLIMTSYKDKAYLIDNEIYSTGLFVKSYAVDDVKKINKEYNYKALNELRREENHFLQK